jgi:hypothetical protein
VNYDPNTGEPINPPPKYDVHTGQPITPGQPAPKRDKGGQKVWKIALGVFLGMLLLLGGCVALIGIGANSASNSLSSDTAHFDKSAAHFRVEYRKVKVGNVLTGKGGMTIAQVVALLGKPDKGDVTVTNSGGEKDVTYDYHFFQATGSPSWVISFTNGKVTDKSSL